MFIEFVVSFLDSANETVKAFFATIFGLAVDIDGWDVTVREGTGSLEPCTGVYFTSIPWSDVNVHVNHAYMRYTFKDKSALSAIHPHIKAMGDLRSHSDIRVSLSRFNLDGDNQTEFRPDDYLLACYNSDTSVLEKNAIVTVRSIVAKQLDLIAAYEMNRCESSRLCDNDIELSYCVNPDFSLEGAEKVLQWCRDNGKASDYALFERDTYRPCDITREVMESAHALCVGWIKDNGIFRVSSHFHWTYGYDIEPESLRKVA